jgi:hypothetical protein
MDDGSEASRLTDQTPPVGPHHPLHLPVRSVGAILVGLLAGCTSGTMTANGGSAAPTVPGAGCYQFVDGSIGWGLPASFHLDTTVGTVGFERGRTVLRPVGPYARAFWSNREGDTIVMTWALRPG